MYNIKRLNKKFNNPLSLPITMIKGCTIRLFKITQGNEKAIKILTFIYEFTSLLLLLLLIKKHFQNSKEDRV